MVMFPSTLGGGNWSGLSYDAARGLVFTNIMNLGAGRADGAADRRTPRADDPTGARRPGSRAYGRFWNPETKVPCSAPPFGELLAVDVNRAEVVWRVPLGVFDDLKARGFDRTGTPNIGGTIATASGLVFVGAHDRSALPRVRRRHGRAAVGNDARGQRARDADDVHGPRRPPVRRRRRRRRRAAAIGAGIEDRRVRAGKVARSFRLPLPFDTSRHYSGVEASGECRCLTRR